MTRPEQQSGGQVLPAVGSRGTYGDFPAVVVAHYYGMLEVRLPGGIACIDAGSFVRGDA